MGEPYGPYPTIDSLSHDYNDSQISDESHLTYVAEHTTNGSKLRRHAACDECRKRKLKCTGEPTGCTRCVKNIIPCVYSQQKTMGRPRKRQRTDEGPTSPLVDEIQYTYVEMPKLPIQPLAQVEEQLQDAIDPSLSNIDQELTDFQNVCPGPIAQTIRSQRESNTLDSRNAFDHTGDATSLDYPYTRYPTDISLWPDFSTIDKLPLPLTTKWGPDPTNDLDYQAPSAQPTADTEATRQYYDPDADPSALAFLPTIPSCPCLPNLYLALSTLATLSSFPISQHTVDTLLSAHKTAYSVIYCPVCPQQYQSGSQNLMIGCTLLNVIADHWHRVRITPPEGLKNGFGVLSHASASSGNASFISVKEGQAWRDFVSQMIRAHVFGDASIPKPPNSSASSTAPSPPLSQTHSSQEGPSVPKTNTLLSIISALERRQRQWHRLDTPTDEFPDRNLTEHPAYARPAGHTHVHEREDHVNSVKASSATASRSQADTNGATKDSIEHEATEDNDTNPDHKEPSPKNGHSGHDNMMCLTIISHSKNILKALEVLK